MVKVSIIIPYREINEQVLRCLSACEKLEGNKEIIGVSDLVCPGLPAAKRNWAMQIATGDIFAFIDSDAYPSEKWLKHALFWIRHYPAVCGPGVLPGDASFRERVADQVHKWMFCPYRVTPQEHRMVPWFPSFNLIVRREVATPFEGYLTGEDDKFCGRIKGGIFYHPSILVYHNRREIFKPLWKQFGTWGRRKGYFFRLSVIAWLTTLWVYLINFVQGFFKKGLS